jgi:cytochrome c-type biogenesis protein CcmH/NrfG
MVGARSVLAAMACAWLLTTGGCAKASLVEQARALSRQNRDPEAIALLRRRLNEDPSDHAARRLLIRVYAASGELGHAQAEVEELRRRSPPGDPVPLIELGHAFELSHRFEEALAAYDEAASVAPASPVGPREGGMRCARWGEVEEARPRLEEAIRRGARDAEIWHALGLTRVHLGDLPAAEEAYRSGLQADPRSAENALGMATVAVIREDGAAALSAYDRVLAIRPAYLPAELGRAWAFIKMGQKEKARAALDRAAGLGASPSHVQKLKSMMEGATP